MRQSYAEPNSDNSTSGSSHTPGGKRGFRFGKKGKVAVALLLVLLVAYVFVSYQLGPVVAQRLSRQIADQSNGKYRLEVKAARVNLLQSSLLVKDLRLIADSSAGDLPLQVEATVPLVKIELPFRQFFNEGPLQLDNIGLVRPEVSAMGMPSKGNASFESDLISQGIHISRLEVEKGTINLRGRDSMAHTFILHDLDLELEDLDLNEEGWDYGSLELGASLEDLSWPLPDSVHYIRLGQLHFSSEEKSLIAENMKLLPRGRDSSDFSARVDLPRISLRGFSLEDLIRRRRLQLESIDLSEPDIRLVGKLETQAPQKLNASFFDEIFPILKPWIRLVSASQIGVQGARLVQVGLDNKLIQHVDGLSIGLQGFELDSLPRAQLMRSRDIRLEADEYEFRLNDDYVLKGKGLWLSTLSRFFQTDSLQLSPLHNKAPYSLAIPSLIIEGLDANAAWFDRNVSVKKIHVAQPIITARQVPEKEASQLASLAEKDLYSFVSGALKSLKVDELEMEDGQLSLRLTDDPGAAPFTASKVALWIKDFVLQPNRDNNRPFNAADVRISLDADQYAFTLPDSSHQILLHSLRISTADSAIIVDSLRFKPLLPNMQSSLSMLAPQVSFYGLNALSLIRDRRLEVDRLKVHQAKIGFYQPSGGKVAKFSPQTLHSWATKQLSAIGLRKLELKEADVLLIKDSEKGIDSLHIPSADLSLQNVLFAKFLTPEENDWRFADGLSFSLRNIDQPLANNQRMKLDSVWFSTDKGLLTGNGLNIDGENAGLHLPAFELGGIRFFDIIETGNLNLNALRLISPEIEIEHAPADSGHVEIERGYFANMLPETINSLSIEGVQVEKGRLTHHGGASDMLKIDDVQLHLAGVRLDKQEQRFRFRDVSLSLHVDDARFVSADSSTELRLGHIGFRRSGEVLIVDSVQLRSLKGSPIRALVPQVRLEGVKIKELIKKRKAAVSSIRMIQPKVHIEGGDKPINRSQLQRWSQGYGLFPVIKNWLDTLQADQLIIENGSIDMEPKKGIRWNVEDFSLQLDNFLIDKYERVNRYLYADELELEVCKHHLTLPDSLYHIDIGNWKLDTRNKRFDIEALFLEPRLGMYEFAASRGYAIDRADLHIPRMRAFDLDVRALFTQHKLHLGRLQVFSPSLDLFRDAQQPDSFPPSQATMHELLRNFPLLLEVDSIYIDNGRIRYALHEDDADRPGELSFDNITLTGTAFSNEKNFHKKHPETIFDGQFKSMDSVDVSIRFRFDNEDPNDRYTITGVMGSAPDLGVFNPMLEPAGFVSIRDGEAEKLIFSMEMDKDMAEGRMRFYYDDLRVKVLSKKKETFKGFESFLANSFVLRKSNPRAQFLRVGRICYEREPRRSVFRFWARSFLTGVQSSIGLKEKEGKIKDLFRFGKKE